MVHETKTLPFAELKIEGSDDGPGGFEGRASTFGSIDSYGDMTERGAYADTIPDFLSRGFLGWGHDWSDPIGYFTDADEKADGLWVKGEFHGDAEAQRYRQRTAERAAAGKFTGLSIGFQPLDFEFRTIDDREIRVLTKIKLFEVSLVSVPAEPNAHVTAVKALDELPELMREMLARIEALEKAQGGPLEAEELQERAPELANVDPALLREINRFRELDAMWRPAVAMGA